MLEEHERTKQDPPMFPIDIFRDPFLRSVMFIGMIVTSSGQLSGHGTVCSIVLVKALEVVCFEQRTF